MSSGGETQKGLWCLNFQFALCALRVRCLHVPIFVQEKWGLIRLVIQNLHNIIKNIMDIPTSYTLPYIIRFQPIYAMKLWTNYTNGVITHEAPGPSIQFMLTRNLSKTQMCAKCVVYISTQWIQKLLYPSAIWQSQALSSDVIKVSKSNKGRKVLLFKSQNISWNDAKLLCRAHRASLPKVFQKTHVVDLYVLLRATVGVFCSRPCMIFLGLQSVKGVRILVLIFINLYH